MKAVFFMAVAVAVSSAAYAESTGRKIWVCQEEYSCMSISQGVTIYPSKLGRGRTRGEALSLRWVPGYDCRPGTLQKSSPVRCEQMSEDAN